MEDQSSSTGNLPSPETPQFPTSKPKSKGKIIGWILIALVVIALAGGLAYLFMQYQEQSKKVDDLQGQLKTAQDELNTAKGEAKTDDESDDAKISDADQIKAAYIEVGNDVKCLKLDDIEIKNSSVSPFQTVQVGCSLPDVEAGGHVELFYRVSPTAPWRYFSGTQGLLPCDRFTPAKDWRKAFADESCYYDTNTTTTVKAFFEL